MAFLIHTPYFFSMTFEQTVTITMLLSEAALAKDWDTPEEDAAWENL